MDKSLRQHTDLSVEDGLKDFASDVEFVKKAYPPEKAMKLLPDVKNCLVNVRARNSCSKSFTEVSEAL